MRTNKKYTKAQWYALIRKWESSGLSQAKFNDEHQISKSTFGYWRKKYLLEQKQPSSKRMIPVHILPSEEPQPVEEVQNLEIVYPNGVRVVCPVQMESSRVKALIH